MSGTSKSNVSDTSTLFFPDLLSAQNRVLLKAGPRPSSPRPTTAPRPGGPVAQSWFSTVFLSSGKSTRNHRSASACKMDDGEFEFVYHFNHLNPCFCLLHVVQIRTFSFSGHRDRGLFIIERCKLFPRGGHFRNFWVGMCRWEPVTLNLYQR